MSETAQNKLYTDEKLDTSVYKCPNCGGEAVFDAELQKMRCLYCDSTFEVKNEEKVTEKSIDDLLNNAKVWDEAEVYQCKTCGAKEILNKQEVAMTCPFCGTNNIVKTEELPGLKPQGVVPFKISKERAGRIATNWARRKFWAPNAFKKSASPEKLAGLYNPVFTFDAETSSTYDGQLGKNYTTVRYINGKPITEVHTRYFYIKGSKNITFDDYIIQASSNLNTNTIKEISPFPTNDAPVYKTEYLRGYSANTYNKDGKQCWNECQNLMKYDIEKAILSKYDYDIKSYLNIKTAYLKQKYKFVLVPLYVGHCKYKNKLYNFFINGSTGKITGKTPVSGWKVFLAVLFGILLVGGIALIVNFFGN